MRLVGSLLLVNDHMLAISQVDQPWQGQLLELVSKSNQSYLRNGPTKLGEGTY